MTYELQFALVRPLPRSFASALQQHPPLHPIDVDRAYQQHERYTEALRSCGGELIVLGADEKHPDSCFIEDTAIVVGRDVIIARIGASSRQQESEAVYAAFLELQKRQTDLKIHRLQSPASLDGGDVLQLGGRVFVGLSQRTNQAAVEQLEKILPGRVHSLPVASGLHLKSVLSHLDAQTLIASAHPDARAMVQKIQNVMADGLGFRCLIVPDQAAANVVRAGSTLLIQAGFPRSEEILSQAAAALKLKIVTLDMSELIKADGALTCCSILIHPS